MPTQKDHPMSTEERLAHILDLVPMTRSFEPFNWRQRARAIGHSACAGIKPNGRHFLYLQIGDADDPTEQYVLNQLAALHRLELIQDLVQANLVVNLVNPWQGPDAAETKAPRTRR